MTSNWLKGLLLATAVVAAAGAARAADIDTSADTYLSVTPPSPVVYDFSGVYFGLQGGGRWGQFDTVFGGTGFDSETNGFTGGPIGGIAFQADRLVYGLETDISFNTGDETTLVAGVPVTNSNDWTGTVRGRLGYAFDRAMIYGTGGLAVGEVGLETPAGSESSTEVGWTLGAGLEMPINENFTARAEYLYTDLGEATGTIAGTPFASEFDSHTVRAGVTYKFQ